MTLEETSYKFNVSIVDFVELASYRPFIVQRDGKYRLDHT